MVLLIIGDNLRRVVLATVVVGARVVDVGTVVVLGARVVGGNAVVTDKKLLVTLTIWISLNKNLHPPPTFSCGQ